MEIYSHPDIESIINIEGNQTCIDCGAAKPKWSSINNGVFLCLKCANIHKSFGNRISIPRSLQIDAWDDKQIAYLKKGGNETYKTLLKSYNIPLSATLDLKYKSKAIDYYRRCLRQEVEKELDKNHPTQEIDRPDLVTGLDLLDSKTYNKDSIDNDLVGTQNPMMKTKQENKLLESIGGFFAKAKENITSSSKTIENKISNWYEKFTKRNQESSEPNQQQQNKGGDNDRNKP